MRALTALLVLFCLSAPLAAQDSVPPEQPPAGGEAEAAPVAPPADAPPPAYEPQLLRLAEILGAVHYLRGLCGAEDEPWRSDMAALLEAEDPTPTRRTRLVARFNRGYNSFAATYRECTNSAYLLVDRYMDEGARLAQDIASRYGT